MKGPANFRQLIHALNQAHRREWERAERLQAELDDIQRSRAWRLVGWLRRFRRWFCRPARGAANAGHPTGELTSLPQSARGTVSIIIPFRDQVGLLKNLLGGLRVTGYRRFEVVLVDNGSRRRRTRRFLTRLDGRRRVRVLSAPGAFNFSLLSNLGAARARGDYLLFLNNDIEVLDPDWLEHLLRLAAHVQVGVAGATLLYPDGTLQHAGIFPEAGGRWSHAHRGLPGDFPGREGEMRRVRSVPAVTGACLLLRRALFEELGGFREDLPITGNDVDLCVRVRERGLLVAITPHARLLHFESLTRGYARDPFRMAPFTRTSGG